MFGFKRQKADNTDTQIPYQVYETVHQPAARRRRWMIRLVVALLAATLLVAGVVGLRSYLRERSSGQPGNQLQHVEQPPQVNQPLPSPEGQPADTPASGSNNDQTVTQPE